MSEARADAPHISFVMPCYNEEEVVGYVARTLCRAFLDAGHKFELIAVDNGSRDRTSEILKGLAAEGLPVVVERVEVNEGYGNGVLRGIPRARGEWIGIIPADGQVDPVDVVKLYEICASSPRPVLAKVRRRFRLDGLRRKLVSVAYNVMVMFLWPGLGSIDVNGSPKIIPARFLRAMACESKQWFLDPEIMIKAHYLGLGVIEKNVFAQMRSAGISHVRMTTCWEFFSKLVKFRFTGPIQSWRRRLHAGSIPDAAELMALASPQRSR